MAISGEIPHLNVLLLSIISITSISTFAFPIAFYFAL